MDKIRTDVLEMLSIVPDGASLAVGGFGLTGAPIMLCDALCELDKRDLHIVANNAGIDPTGVGRLAQEGRLRKFTGSFPSNKNFFSLFHEGRVELELVPQGTLAERMRAAGAGIPAFYTPTGAGTDLATGNYPARYDSDGNVVQWLEPKDVRVFNGRPCVLETALACDFALVKAHRADRLGNLAFRLGSRNFNVPAAMAGAVTFVEAQNIVEVGAIEPDAVHLPGVFVQHVIQSTGGWVGNPNPPGASW
ncbi:MAG: 3-oxoacid CoA-transferase subunit A [Actinobacteria bacterium]|jgi:3-oxoacid CoA-transferase subunit A|nr:3-oxoacid CoA-transferase subunit A [Actinomycetota bacterium]